MICILSKGKVSRSYLLGDLGDFFLRKVALRSGFASPGGLCVGALPVERTL